MFEDLTDQDPTQLPVQPPPQSITIDTPMFKLELKSVSKFNSEIQVFKSWLPLAMYDALADKIIYYIVPLVHKIQVAVLGKEKAVEEPVQKVFPMFDSSGFLKPEFASRMSSTRVVEATFAELAVLVESLKQLEAQRDTLHPTAKDRIQFALDTTVTPYVKITDIGEAIDYRRKRCKEYRTTQAEVAAAKKGLGEIPATAPLSAEQLLAMPFC